MDYLDYVNEDQRVPPARHVLADKSDPFQHFDDISFRDRFRMYKKDAMEIISQLNLKLLSVTQRGRPLPVCLQVLMTLRFLACGTFHRETGDLFGVSEPTVCKVIHRVCRAICELRGQYINFPDATIQVNYKVSFCEYGHFPGVIGCIDGTHVPIKCPSTPDAEEYRNRKNWFSINVQGVCTPQLQFSNIVARWKGATHDSRIFLNSSLYAQFERGEHNGILLGDSGYAQKNFLFTPYLHPTTAEQWRYNQAHMLTRALVERMFGIWKSRFQCLRKTLRFKPRRCCIVIIATAVLHNYLKQRGCPDPPVEEDDNPVAPPFTTDAREGLAYRDAFALCHLLFTLLFLRSEQIGLKPF
ncbi:putative nuclease HARBI1 [Astyanax mexicanus]|uniref:Putative nuclease HARBI1 n=1 Tax=Astyanax mexicanus TaxID=7994 RepID=A0A8T2MKP0_ASTMX|nr:putative nuclease HARBI1 [Astyanax mexicanus]